MAVITWMLIASLCGLAYGYIPCSSCIIPHQIPPGNKACYSVQTKYQITEGRVEKCKNVTECVSNPADPFGGSTICSPVEKCSVSKTRKVAIPVCKLKLRKKGIYRIPKSEEGEFGFVYQIDTPKYFSNRSYPQNTLCVYNLTDSGPVNFRIIDQKLQMPSDNCHSRDCSCPDMVEVTMGNNGMKLCGSGTPQIDYQRSPRGLTVTFCSDNAIEEKGALIMAYQQKNRSFAVMPTGATGTRRRRQATPSVGSMASCEDRMAVMSSNMSRMGCQYEYMMRMAQPGVECPSDDIILNLIHYGNYMMTDFSQDMDMCDGMDEMTDDMPMMNQVESCAVNYLYRTRDRQFAQKLLATSNGELRDVAQMIVNGKFPMQQPN